jgi:hypothetical protein
MKQLNGEHLVEEYRRNLRVVRYELSLEREETVVRNIVSGILSQHGGLERLPRRFEPHRS